VFTTGDEIRGGTSSPEGGKRKKFAESSDEGAESSMNSMVRSEGKERCPQINGGKKKGRTSSEEEEGRGFTSLGRKHGRLRGGRILTWRMRIGILYIKES